jgi:O-antigen/teichoic acid export membrane protein
MVVLALGFLGSSIAGPAAIVLNMTGHQDASARTYAVVALANVALNAVLIPRLGIVGAALATALTTTAGSAWLYRLVRRGLRVDPTLRGTRRGVRRDA